MNKTNNWTLTGKNAYAYIDDGYATPLHRGEIKHIKIDEINKLVEFKIPIKSVGRIVIEFWNSTDFTWNRLYFCTPTKTKGVFKYDSFLQL